MLIFCRYRKLARPPETIEGSHLEDMSFSIALHLLHEQGYSSSVNVFRANQHTLHSLPVALHCQRRSLWRTLPPPGGSKPGRELARRTVTNPAGRRVPLDWFLTKLGRRPKQCRSNRSPREGNLEQIEKGCPAPPCTDLGGPRPYMHTILKNNGGRIRHVDVFQGTRVAHTMMFA